MRHLIAVVLAAVLFALPAIAAVPKGVDMGKVTTHLKEHQEYPATRKQLIESCYDLKDFSDVEKKWFLGALPDGTYKSADEVVAALKAAK
jgi:hypothetical protein